MAYRRLEQRRAARREQSAGAGPPTRSRSRPTPEGGRRQAWTRVARSRADAVAARLSAPSAGALAAAWSAVISLLVVAGVIIGAWILGTGAGNATNVLKISGVAWLAIHHIPIAVPGGDFSALPLGLMVIPGVLLWRAGSWASRRSGALRWADVRTTVGVAAAVYATVGMFVAGFSATDDAWIEPLSALLGMGLFAVLAFGGGASRTAGLWPTLADRLSVPMRRWLRACAGALMTLTGGAALLIAASLVWHFTTATDMASSLDAGVIGGLTLLLLSVAYLPNMVMWAVAFACGPGFAIGESTVISPFNVEAGALPAFPLLAAIPESAPSWSPVVLVLPMAAGGVAVVLAGRGRPIGLGGLAALRERVWIAGLIAAAVGFACLFASGGIGSGRLSVVGPSALQVAAACFGLTLLGGWLTDAARTVARRRGTSKAVRSVDLTASAQQATPRS